MKTLRRLCIVFILTMCLALSALAGEMSTGIIDTPPPPGQHLATTGDMTTGLTGDMSTGLTGDISTSVTATDPVTAVALSLLQSLLPLF